MGVVLSRTGAFVFICTVGFVLPAFGQEKNQETKPSGPVVHLSLQAGSAELNLPTVLNLATAERIALKGNPGLRAAQARIRQAQQRVKQALSSYFPQFAGRVSASKTLKSEEQLKAERKAITQQAVSGFEGEFYRFAAFGVTGFFSNPLNILTPAIVTGIQTASALDVDETTEAYTAQLSGTWLLFDGFEREFTYRAARFGKQESEAAYQEAQRLLLSAIAAAFYQAQLARQNTAIADADEEFNQRLLKEAEARRRVGTGPLSDVLNFKVQVNQAKASRIEAQRAFAVAMSGLAQLMGLPEAGFPDGQELAQLEDEKTSEMQLPDVQSLIRYAEAYRPDIHQQEMAVQRTKASAKARRGPFYPDVTATWSKDVVSDQDLGFSTNDFTTTVGLTVTYTFFAGGRNRALLKEAKMQHEEAQWNLNSTQLQAAKEVRQGVDNLKAAQDSLRLQRENAELVRRNRDLVEKGYLVGQESLVRLTQADRDYIAAETELARALVSLRSAWHDLRTATGQTLELVESH